MQLKRKSYIVNENDLIIYDRNGGISKKYLSRYNSGIGGYRIVKTYKCPSCTQNNCRIMINKKPFMILDSGLCYKAPCSPFNGSHRILMHSIHLINKDTLQEAIKVIYDNLCTLNNLSLETTLLITNMYNFFLSQGEYDANNKM